MTTVQIHIPDDRAATLKAEAAEHGFTLEEWISRKLAEKGEEAPAQSFRSAQEGVARILELQKRVKPDPEGWTVRDYINYGRP